MQCTPQVCRPLIILSYRVGMRHFRSIESWDPDRQWQHTARYAQVAITPQFAASENC